MGEYHNNLTLEEAIKIYESIPAERCMESKGLVLICRTGMRIIPGNTDL